jgi:hypothetical protein
MSDGLIHNGAIRPRYKEQDFLALGPTGPWMKNAKGRVKSAATVSILYLSNAGNKDTAVKSKPLK